MGQQQLVERCGHPVEGRLGAERYVAGALLDDEGNTAEVEQAEAGVVRTEVGHREQAGGRADPQPPGSPPAAGGARALLDEEPGVDQLLDTQGDARRRQAGDAGQLRARLGVAGGDETQQIALRSPYRQPLFA